jgi:hypothetical protein
MKKNIYLILGISTVLASTEVSKDPFKSGRTEDGRTTFAITVPLSEAEDDLVATFDFGHTKGFLGSSADPTAQAGFSNADNTILAVNHQPATKSSYVHLFLRSPASGDLVYLNNVNDRIARLLKGKWADTATGFLRVESISDRNITFQTADLGATGRESYNFTVTVSPEGTFSLAKQAKH